MHQSTEFTEEICTHYVRCQARYYAYVLLGHFCPLLTLVAQYNYSNVSEADLKTLVPIYHQGIQLCTGTFCSSPTTSLLKKCGLLPLSHKYNIRMCYALRIQAGDSPTSDTFTLPDVFLIYISQTFIPHVCLSFICFS